MRQVVLNQPGEFVIGDAPPPAVDRGEALVRVHRVGVCGTDLNAFAGRHPFFEYPRVLGHELGVEVVDVPANDRGIQPGDRCAVEPYLACGACRACQIGKTNCCEDIRVLGVHTNGGMRELAAVPVHLLHKSPRLSFDELALVETLGIGAHAVRRSGLVQGEQTLVVGAGPVGLAVTQFAQVAGAAVCVLEVSPARRGFVEQFGIETLAAPDDRRADVVFDATGNKQAMEASFRHVAHGGRLVFVGVVRQNITFDDPSFHAAETTLLASRNSVGLFPTIIRMIEQGRIDTTPWITYRLELADVPAGFAEMAGQSDLLKAVIEVRHDDI